MSLERHLVLNRWLHSQLGARGLEELTAVLGAGRVIEGPAGDGQSHFHHVLAARPGVMVAPERLDDYDARILTYEARLARGRPGLTLKYFQYLSLLYTEILLDRLTDDPGRLVSGLNAFLRDLHQAGIATATPAFVAPDLRRLAFFLATGAGKTLLLHANLWQVEHYLAHGRHPDALVRRADGRREFEGVYLVTPNEGLSRQHLAEFAVSGIDARHLVLDPPGLPSVFGLTVRVVEMSKLADQPSGDGVSIALDSLGSANLVFVDEGHKGTGSEAQTWKRRQRMLSADGTFFEYSATFAQAIGAARRTAQAGLLADYGKSIVFDYSYRHFYGEEFGKDFAVVNVESPREEQAFDVLLGGLLLFYQQTRLFHDQREALRPFRIEAPLWVFLGSSVNAVYTRGGRKQSDVATAVGFLRRFLEDRAWAEAGLARVLAGESGFRGNERRRDVFAERLGFVASAPGLYDAICRDVFHGSGALEAWDIAGADGELGLRTSVPGDPARPYFAVVNVGDLSGFRRHLEEHLSLITQEDRFHASLFGEIDRPDASVSILLGARKFVEGWSSWRVSTMGLLNMGRSEGPQVIQLFGRGVRLRGRDGSLRRSAARAEPDPGAPAGLRELETLYIVGWNADYLDAFRDMLVREEVFPTVEIPVHASFPELAELPVPRPRAGYTADRETWTLEPDPAVRVSVDLTPRMSALVGGERRSLGDQAGEDVSWPMIEPLLDFDALYAGVLDYKARRSYGNIFISRSALAPALRLTSLRLSMADARDPGRLQEGALRALTSYLDRFAGRRERSAESRYLEPGKLMVREHVPPAYMVRPDSEEVLLQLRDLVAHPERLAISTEDPPLPRLHMDRHLWAPLVTAAVDGVQVSPPPLVSSEVRFLNDLRNYWAAHHDQPDFRGRELYVLRNPPSSGVGFFRRSGFYPDFIVWLRDAEGLTRLRFVEPHGMHHGGLAGNRDKFEILDDLEALSRQSAFRAAGLDLSGFIVTDTPLDEIPDAADRSWEALSEEYRLLHQSGDYVASVLAETVPRRRQVRITSLRESDDARGAAETTPASRLSMMWQLARDAWAFTGTPDAESRLSRHAVRVYRRER